MTDRLSRPDTIAEISADLSFLSEPPRVRPDLGYERNDLQAWYSNETLSARLARLASKGIGKNKGETNE